MIAHELCLLSGNVIQQNFFACFRDWYWHQKEIEDKLFNLCETMAPPPLLSHHQVSKKTNQQIVNTCGHLNERVDLAKIWQKWHFQVQAIKYRPNDLSKYFYQYYFPRFVKF